MRLEERSIKPGDKELCARERERERRAEPRQREQNRKKF